MGDAGMGAERERFINAECVRAWPLPLLARGTGTGLDCAGAGVGVAGTATAVGWRLRASLPEGLASLGAILTCAYGRSESESEELTTKGSNEFNFGLLLMLAKGTSSACEGV